MEAMVETHLDPPVRSLGSERDPSDVADPDTGRFLHENVCRGAEGLAGVLGQPVVRERDDHDVELVAQELVE
jgi:hypothetical protein